MNIDEKIDAKIKSIDEKMKDGTGIDMFKLQSCARDMGHMGTFGMRGCKNEEDDKAIISASMMIQKLMLLQALNIYEEAIITEK